MAIASLQFLSEVFLMEQYSKPTTEIKNFYTQNIPRNRKEGGLSIAYRNNSI